MADCCNLVGNLEIDWPGVISVSVNSNTQVTTFGDECYILGPTTGTISVVGYATDEIHTGCPAGANVSITWISKYDCDTGEIVFIPQKGGRSTIYGDIPHLATVKEAILTYNILNASASSGPASIYTNTEQTDGIGLIYTGLPKPFDSSNENDLVFDSLGIGPTNTMNLQNFSLSCNPGEVPTASYSFIFFVGNE